MENHHMETFPHELFIKIENENYFIGRIIIHQIGRQFNAEIDIINEESRKIFCHVGIIYDQASGEEARIAGVQRLAEFLQNKNH